MGDGGGGGGGGSNSWLDVIFYSKLYFILFLLILLGTLLDISVDCLVYSNFICISKSLWSVRDSKLPY